MSIELIIDPEFKALIPPLTERELKNLEDSLITDGCIDPLVVWNRTIIDGHNRYEICRSRNIEFKTHEMKFKSRDEAILWILRNQLSRRNLNDFQRIEIVRKCEKEVKDQAKERQGRRNDLEEHSGHLSEMLNEGKESRDELGAMAEVSGKTYERAVKVIDNAPEAVIAAVRKKDLSINSAYRVTKMSHEEQDEIAKRIINGEKPKAVIADVRQRDKANQNIKNSQEAESTQNNAVQDSPESENYLEKHKVISLKLGNEINREAITKLRIEKRADDDCALFIWCQYHILSEIFKSNLIEDCGFKYQTIAFVLTESDKTSELCVLATRGNPILADTPLPKITNVSGKELGQLIKEVVGDISVCELS